LIHARLRSNHWFLVSRPTSARHRELKTVQESVSASAYRWCARSRSCPILRASQTPEYWNREPPSLPVLFPVAAAADIFGGTTKMTRLSRSRSISSPAPRSRRSRRPIPISASCWRKGCRAAQDRVSGGICLENGGHDRVAATSNFVYGGDAKSKAAGLAGLPTRSAALTAAPQRLTSRRWRPDKHRCGRPSSTSWTGQKLDAGVAAPAEEEAQAAHQVLESIH
jgi:hypothetical protein